MGTRSSHYRACSIEGSTTGLARGLSPAEDSEAVLSRYHGKVSGAEMPPTKAQSP